MERRGGRARLTGLCGVCRTAEPGRTSAWDFPSGQSRSTSTSRCRTGQSACLRFPSISLQLIPHCSPSSAYSSLLVNTHLPTVPIKTSGDRRPQKSHPKDPRRLRRISRRLARATSVSSLGRRSTSRSVEAAQRRRVQSPPAPRLALARAASCCPRLHLRQEGERGGRGQRDGPSHGRK